MLSQNSALQFSARFVPNSNDINVTGLNKRFKKELKVLPANLVLQWRREFIGITMLSGNGLYNDIVTLSVNPPTLWEKLMHRLGRNQLISNLPESLAQKKFTLCPPATFGAEKNQDDTHFFSNIFKAIQSGLTQKCD